MRTEQRKGFFYSVIVLIFPSSSTTVKQMVMTGLAPSGEGSDIQADPEMKRNAWTIGMCGAQVETNVWFFESR